MVNEPIPRTLVKEWKASGSAHRRQIQMVTGNTYRAYSRQMVPRILAALSMHFNDRSH